MGITYTHPQGDVDNGSRRYVTAGDGSARIYVSGVTMPSGAYHTGTYIVGQEGNSSYDGNTVFLSGATTVAMRGGNPGTAGSQTAYWDANWGSGSWSGGMGGHISWEYSAPAAPGGAPTANRGSNGTTLYVASASSSGPNVTSYEVSILQEGGSWSAWYANGTTFTGLSSTSTYYARSRANGYGGYSGVSSNATSAGVPTAPGAAPAVTRSSDGTSASGFTATSTSGATYYQVAYAAEGGAYSGWALLPATITGLTSTTNYNFKTRAGNSVGTSDDSAVTFRYGIPTAPASVSTVVSTSVSARITVNWTAPATTNGTISNYEIFRNSSSLGTVSGTTLQYVDSAPSPGATYTYTVRAQNGTGWSATAAATAVTAPGVPGAPTSLSVAQGTASTDDGKLYLAWTAPVFQNPSITGYDVIRSATGLSDVTIALNGTATSYVDTGLTPGTTYSYVVKARNAFADSSGLRSPSSNTVSEMAPGLPTVPLNLAGVGDLSIEGRINLTWNTPTTTNGAITGYRIWRKLSTDSTFPTSPTYTTSGTGTSYSATGLTVGDTYNFKIAALNAYAVSANKSTPETSSISVLSPGVPSAPVLTGATASTTAFGEVVLTWNKPTNTGGGIVDYYLYADGILKASVVGEDTLTGVITGLNQRQSYSFTVRARNAWSAQPSVSKTSAASNALNATAPGAPSAPRSLSAVVPPSPAGVVNLSWSVPLDTAGTLTGYGIYFSDGTLIEDTNSSVTSYQVTGLTPAIRYSFYVKARNVISDVVGIDSASSNTATGIALGDPSEPLNVAVDSTSLVVGRLVLTWDAPVIGGTINAYNVYLANGTKLGSTGSETYVVDGLTPGITHSFYVRARNSVTDAAGTEGGKVSTTVTGMPSSTSSQAMSSVTVTNNTNAVFSGNVNVFSLTSTSLSYIKSSSFEVPQSVVPALSGAVVDNTNVILNGTYAVTATPDVSTIRYSRVGPNFSTTSVPNGTISNETNAIFNGTYEVTDINADEFWIKYEKTSDDITSRAVPADPQATISNITSSVFNADNISISAVTEDTVSFLRTHANVEESAAAGTIFNNTNREIYNGANLIVTSVPTYQKFTYSTGDDVTKENLALNPSMEYAGEGTSILRTNHYANPRMNNSTTGWTLLAAGATQTPDADGTYVDFSEDVAPMEAFFYETTPIAISVGEYAISSYEITVPAGYPELTFTSILRSYGAGDTDTRLVTVKPGTTERVTSYVYQTLATSTGVRHLIGSQDTIVAGSRFIIKNAIFEKTDVLGSYFDGESASALGWDYAWVGTTDASKSVAKAQAVVVRKNEINNPGLEGSTTGETLRVNLFTNPSFEAALTGWTGSGGLTQTRSTSESRLGGASLACTSTASSAYAASPVMSVAAGATYTASAWIKGASGHTVQIGIYEYNSSDVQIGYSSSDDIALTGSWQRISISRDMTSTASTAKVAVVDSIEGDAGQTFYVDDVLFEKTAFLDDYFDGETADADGRSYAWADVEHASTSTVTSSEVYATNLMINPSAASVESGTDIMRINLINNPTPVESPGLVWEVTDAGIGGAYGEVYTGTSFTATTISQAADSTFTLRIGAETGIDSRALVVAGLTYTFSVSVMSSIVDSRAIGIDWHRADGTIISSTNSARTVLAPNVAQRLSVTGVAPTDAVSASLVAARVGAAGVDPSIRTLGSVYTVKEALLEQTDRALEYFSGGLTDSHGWAYEWAGFSNESVSYAKAQAVTTRTNYVPNPSMEDSSSGAVSATNLAINPSMEATSGTATVRENLATNPAMGAATSTSDIRTNLITNPSMETAGAAVTFRENMATNPSFEDATGTVSTPYGTKPAVTGVEAATSSAIAWQDATAASYGSNGVAVEWLQYYGVSTDSGTGLFPFSASTTPYDLTDTFVDGVYSLHPDNSLTPVSGEDGLYTIGF